MFAFGDVELFNVELLHSSFNILHRLADHSTLNIPHSTLKTVMIVTIVTNVIKKKKWLSILYVVIYNKIYK